MSKRELGPYPGLSYAHMVSKDIHSSHVVRRFVLSTRSTSSGRRRVGGWRRWNAGAAGSR